MSQRVLKGLEMQLQELHSDGDFSSLKDSSEDSSCHDGGLKFALSRNGCTRVTNTFSSHHTARSDFFQRLVEEQIILKYLHFAPKYVSVNNVNRATYKTVDVNK